MKRSDQINELMAALAKAQKRILPAPADSKGEVRSERAKYDFYYADLAGVREACREPLADNELGIVQTSHVEGVDVTVTTFLGHSSGQFIENDLTLKAESLHPQKIGACITYARRYELSSMIGVAAEKDEDAPSGGQQPRQGQHNSAPATSAPREIDPLRKPDAAPSIAAPASSAKAEPGSLDEEEKARKAVQGLNSPEAFTKALVEIEQLHEASQVAPRLALAEQIDGYLKQDGHLPTDELKKLMFRIIRGVPNDHRPVVQKIYSSHKWIKNEATA